MSSSHADTIREALERVPRLPQREGAVVALDALLAENQRLREENAELRVEAEALHRLLRGSREALAGDAE